jgi:hypothetical protein
MPFVNKNLKRLGCIFGAILVIAICMIYPIYLFSWKEIRDDVPYVSLSNSIIQQFKLPANAEKISYIKQFTVTRLSFTISLNEFLDWAKQQNLVLSVIEKTDGASGFRVVNGSLDFLYVGQGYRLEEANMCGLLGVYDSKENNCSVTWFCKER